MGNKKAFDEEVVREVMEDGALIVVYKDDNDTFVETKPVYLKEKAFFETISIGDGFNDIMIDFVLFENKQEFKFLEVKTVEAYRNGSTNSNIVIIDINNDGKVEIIEHYGNKIDISTLK